MCFYPCQRSQCQQGSLPFRTAIFPTRKHNLAASVFKIAIISVFTDSAKNTVDITPVQGHIQSLQRCFKLLQGHNDSIQGDSDLLQGYIHLLHRYMNSLQGCIDPLQGHFKLLQRCIDLLQGYIESLQGCIHPLQRHFNSLQRCIHPLQGGFGA